MRAFALAKPICASLNSASTLRRAMSFPSSIKASRASVISPAVVTNCSPNIESSTNSAWRFIGHTALQKVLNPARPGQPAVERFGWRFQIGDKVIQTENDYDKDVFNGDVGIVEKVDPVERQLAIRFDDRIVKYDFGELDEVSLAYAVTIHKSQGSEFPAVVIPLATQHYMLLQRNLIYTGITRGKRLLVLIGQKKALGIAVRNDLPQRRYLGLLVSLLQSRRVTEEPHGIT